MNNQRIDKFARHKFKEILCQLLILQSIYESGMKKKYIFSKLQELKNRNFLLQQQHGDGKRLKYIEDWIYIIRNIEDSRLYID